MRFCFLLIVRCVVALWCAELSFVGAFVASGVFGFLGSPVCLFVDVGVLLSFLFVSFITSLLCLPC